MVRPGPVADGDAGLPRPRQQRRDHRRHVRLAYGEALANGIDDVEDEQRRRRGVERHRDRVGGGRRLECQWRLVHGDRPIASEPYHVHFSPESGRRGDVLACLLSANRCQMHRRKLCRYSITSSARVSINGETVRPIALAALRFMTSSNLVGCSTGRSAGFAPLKILCTNVAARR